MDDTRLAALAGRMRRRVERERRDRRAVSERLRAARKALERRAAEDRKRIARIDYCIRNPCWVCGLPEECQHRERELMELPAELLFEARRW